MRLTKKRKEMIKFLLGIADDSIWISFNRGVMKVGKYIKGYGWAYFKYRDVESMIRNLLREKGILYPAINDVLEWAFRNVSIWARLNNKLLSEWMLSKIYIEDDIRKMFVTISEYPDSLFDKERVFYLEIVDCYSENMSRPIRDLNHLCSWYESITERQLMAKSI